MQPSMILTQHNRYGFQQASTLALWPWFGHALIGPLRKYRGISVERLGQVIAAHAMHSVSAISSGEVDVLQWDDFRSLSR